MMNKSLALCMITNRLRPTQKIIATYKDCFDQLYITVTDKKIYDSFKNLEKHDPGYYANVVFSYYKWDDHFGRARQYNQKQVKTDFWFWMDDDDTLVNHERLRDLVTVMENEDLDCIYLKYNYYQNKQGEAVQDHWRERLIRTTSELRWFEVPVHETLATASGYAPQGRSEWVEVLHHKTEAGLVKSSKRNLKLLEKHWKRTKDPRTAFYLGETYLSNKQYVKALKMFRYLIENGGWDEQKYLAWTKCVDCAMFMEEYEAALTFTNEATNLDPSNPDAYYQKAIVYGMQENWDKAIEWVKVAMVKKPNDQSLQMTDPTKYAYKGQFIAAQAYLFAGRPKEAFKLYQHVKSIAPHFIEEQSVDVKWDELFEEMYYEQKAIDYVRYLTHYLKDYKGNPQKLFEALPETVRNNPQLNPERLIAFPPKKWPDKSIAIFCGPGTEAWGPDTLDKGMGGSEESVVYNAKELAKLGWNVDVFNERDDEYCDTVFRNGAEVGGVWYHPWSTLNPNDEFDVFVAWRAPEQARGVKARKVICDVHDVIQPERIYEAAKYIDLFMVKSNYHRNLYPDLPDNKFVIIGNGIVAEQFK